MAKNQQKSLDLFPEESTESGAQAQLESSSPARSGYEAGSAGEEIGSGVADYHDLSGKTVFVVDCHSLIYQVFHAIAEMTAPDGRAANAIYGFTRDLLDILTKRKPDFLFCAFDVSEVTFRNELYPEYKAHREPMPEDLRSQIPEIQRLLAALAIPVLQLQGFEADDIMATLARESEERGADCVLVTSDKDCRQLITNHVRLLNMRKGQLYEAADLQADWGISPHQVVDFQALVGDTADNVPGVPTIGPKTATQLLQEFGTLEDLLSRVEEVKGKKGEKIRESAELAKLSQQLVRLDKQVPIPIDWNAARLGGMDVEAAVALCQEFGFRSLTDRVRQLSPIAREAPPAWDSAYRALTETAEIRELIARIAKLPRFCLDTETTSAQPRWAELVGVSLGWEPGQAVYIPVRAPAGTPTLPEHELLDLLRPLVSDPEREIIGQNLKYDQVVLRGAGLELSGRFFDTMVADYLVNPGHNVHNMDDLALRFLNHKTIKITELIGSGRNQKRMDEVPLEQIAEYAAEDADVPLRLRPLLQHKLEQFGLEQLFNEVEMPLTKVLAEMEFNGIAVDPAALRELSAELTERIAQLQDEIQALAGLPFNPDSPQQLAEILFDRLGLPAGRRTKSGLSTDVDVLEELAPRHPLPAKVVEYRQLAKLRNTYAEALLEQICPRTGRVHTSFMQDVARTGRLSSKDPNLQNIPIRTATGRRIRQAFVAGKPNEVLLTADYSQIELRVLAHFCEDPVLVAAFERDEDIHRVVAAQVYDVAPDDVTDEMRRQAKAVNFGIIYGQSPFGLARELGIPKDDAATFINAYFGRYPAVEGFIREVLERAAEQGYVSTILGRRRPVEGVRKPSTKGFSRSRTAPERIAVNTVIQGSAADIIKLAMIEVHRSLRQLALPAKLLLQIHDELVLEVDRSALPEVATLVRDKMIQAVQLKVPLKVAVEAGPNWNDTEPVL
jgi:DNA polymerase-1